jgi:hypothetical protein
MCLILGAAFRWNNNHGHCLHFAVISFCLILTVLQFRYFTPYWFCDLLIFTTVTFSLSLDKNLFLSSTPSGLTRCCFNSCRPHKNIWTFVSSRGTFVHVHVSLNSDTTAPVAQAKRSAGLPSHPRVSTRVIKTFRLTFLKRRK